MDKDRQGTNERLRDDEIQVLASMYTKEWNIEDSQNNVYSINISSNSGNNVYLQVTLPDGYPLDSPPIYEISAPWMSREAKYSLCCEMEEIYCSNIGDSILYLWIEQIKNFIEEDTEEEDDVSNLGAEMKKTLLDDVTQLKDEIPLIEHGEPIVDRKSTFQAHVAYVVSVQQVNQVFEKLKENRKIATATHNILAYRIARENNSNYFQDFDDDGETKAGSVLLHLLQVLNVSNIMVVVSRWYGGIHLGPDRFKHISNAARSLLCQLGYVPEQKTKPGSSKSSKK